MNQLPLYNSLFPFLVLIIIFATFLTYYGATWPKRVKNPELLARIHKSFLGIFFYEFWFWVTEPIVKFFVILRLTPNNVTLLALLLSIYNGYLFYSGHIAAAGWLLIISGSMDFFDGRVARATNRSTKAGAFFDACLDRYSDAFVFLGISFYFLKKAQLEPPLWDFNFFMGLVSLMALVGTEIMSYVKARGEAMGFSTKRGLMQRPERIVLLAFFSSLYPFLSFLAIRNDLPADSPLYLAMILMAFLVNISALSRLLAIFNDIKKTESVSGE